MSIGPQLQLSPGQRALLDALCDHRVISGNSCMSAEHLKKSLGWNDQELFAVVHTLGNPTSFPPKQILTYRSHRLTGSPQDVIDEVCLDLDGMRYCDGGRPSSI